MFVALTESDLGVKFSRIDGVELMRNVFPAGRGTAPPVPAGTPYRTRRSFRYEQFKPGGVCGLADQERRRINLLAVAFFKDEGNGEDCSSKKCMEVCL